MKSIRERADSKQIQKEVETIFYEHRLMRDWIFYNLDSSDKSLAEDAERLLTHLKGATDNEPKNKKD